jgi:adenine-specific DNA-methyltransferase
MARQKRPAKSQQAESYAHPDSTLLLRPDAGTQAQFKKSKTPQRYRYDSSLSPALEWDGQNSAREQGEALIAEILALSAKLNAAVGPASRAGPAHGGPDVPGTARLAAPTELVALLGRLDEAARRLKALGKPFLNWAGKAERLSFDVPTLPLFVHERLSTKAIIETLIGHKRDKQPMLFDLFADPCHSIADQVLKAYEYRDQWTNRMILGDSLVVMNSLLHFENLGGQVQMIYMDPPYGIKYGSNFQPFVRRRDVKHNDDDDLTREPEMVQAYRDTWEIGLHSYLTCMRDRLLLCRDLLAPSGSVFVQISDVNIHHIREVMDEVFGEENRVGLINFVKSSGLAAAENLGTACDYLVWYARDRERIKYNQLFVPKESKGEGITPYSMIELADAKRRQMTREEREGTVAIPEKSRRYRIDNLTKPGPGSRFDFEFEGQRFGPGKRWWGTTPEGMSKLAEMKRLQVSGQGLWYVRFWDDFPWSPVNNLWTDTGSSFLADKLYVVQTTTKTIERCLLMTTDPGDLVLDPTCGSGTTAYVAEQWGRRWITADVSRVPLALARQRLLTATFPWYDLKDEERGPAGGFVYKRKQNKKGEEVGGIVPHVTLKSIANNEPPTEEVLVDRPEKDDKITRVTGPFTFEATIPTAADVEVGAAEVGPASRAGPATPPVRLGSPDLPQNESSRMLEVLRRSPVLRLDGNRTITLHNIRPPAKSLSLSAEAMVKNGNDKPVAFVFGPENAAVSEKLVKQAAFEAKAKSFAHLYVIGFAIQPHARQLVDQCEAVMDIPATYVQATPDLLMGDLLKNMRSSQIFSVCGLPEIEVRQCRSREPSGTGGKKGPARLAGPTTKYEVELLGLDVFDPTTIQNDPRRGDDVPAWFLDTDYNDLCFHVCQAFFPRTSAWENLKKALKGDYSETVWDHLAGTVSAPFEAGEHQQIAVKVIDDRGNELVVVRKLL